MTDNPTPAPIVFIDVESTGLDSHTDQIWEFAGVRRAADGSESELHLFVEHDVDRCRHLPEPFLTDHSTRFPGACSGDFARAGDAATSIARFLMPVRDATKPVVAGGNPGFDLRFIDRLIRAHILTFGAEGETWRHHTPVDVVTYAAGVLGLGQCGGPPWPSEDISRALGIDPGGFARHTAMGDVRWAMAIYDKARALTVEIGSDV